MPVPTSTGNVALAPSLAHQSSASSSTTPTAGTNSQSSFRLQSQQPTSHSQPSFPQSQDFESEPFLIQVRGASPTDSTLSSADSSSNNTTTYRNHPPSKPTSTFSQQKNYHSHHPSPPPSKLSSFSPSTFNSPQRPHSPTLPTSAHQVPPSPPSSRSSASPKSVSAKVTPGSLVFKTMPGSMVLDDEESERSFRRDDREYARSRSTGSSIGSPVATSAPLPPISQLARPPASSFSEPYPQHEARHFHPTAQSIHSTPSYLPTTLHNQQQQQGSLSSHYNHRLRLPKPASFMSPPPLNRPSPAPANGKATYIAPSISTGGSPSGGSLGDSSPIAGHAHGRMRVPSIGAMQISGQGTGGNVPHLPPPHQLPSLKPGQLPPISMIRPFSSSSNRDDHDHSQRPESRGILNPPFYDRERERERDEYTYTARPRGYSIPAGSSRGGHFHQHHPSQGSGQDVPFPQHSHYRQPSLPPPPPPAPTGAMHQQFANREAYASWIDSHVDISSFELPKALHYMSQCAENVMKVTSLLGYHLLPEDGGPESEEKLSALLNVLSDADLFDLLEQTRTTHDSLAAVFKIINRRVMTRDRRGAEVPFGLAHYQGIPPPQGRYVHAEERRSFPTPIPTGAHQSHPARQGYHSSHHSMSMPNPSHMGSQFQPPGRPVSSSIPSDISNSVRKGKVPPFGSRNSSSPFSHDQHANPINIPVTGAGVKKKRGRLPPPTRCLNCNRQDTPEWRRGPDGARTLCNACGLHYAKTSRRQESLKTGVQSSQREGASPTRSIGGRPTTSGGRSASRSRSQARTMPALAIDKVLMDSGLVSSSDIHPE